MTKQRKPRHFAGAARIHSSLLRLRTAADDDSEAAAADRHAAAVADRPAIATAVTVVAVGDALDVILQVVQCAGNRPHQPLHVPGTAVDMPVAVMGVILNMVQQLLDVVEQAIEAPQVTPQMVRAAVMVGDLVDVGGQARHLSSIADQVPVMCGVAVVDGEFSLQRPRLPLQGQRQLVDMFIALGTGGSGGDTHAKNRQDGRCKSLCKYVLLSLFDVLLPW